MVKDHVLTVLTDAWIVITVKTKRRKCNMNTIIVLLILFIIYPPLAFVGVAIHLTIFFCKCTTNKEYRREAIRKKKAEKHVVWLSNLLDKASKKLKSEV
jgi:hypothetical protein